jgi:hypothetical protein
MKVHMKLHVVHRKNKTREKGTANGHEWTRIRRDRRTADGPAVGGCPAVTAPVPTAVGLASEAALQGCRGSSTFHFSPITFHLLTPSLSGLA